MIFRSFCAFLIYWNSVNSKNPFPRVLLPNNYQKPSKIFRQKKINRPFISTSVLKGFERKFEYRFLFVANILNPVVNFLWASTVSNYNAVNPLSLSNELLLLALCEKISAGFVYSFFVCVISGWRLKPATSTGAVRLWKIFDFAWKIQLVFSSHKLYYSNTRNNIAPFQKNKRIVN